MKIRRVRIVKIKKEDLRKLVKVRKAQLKGVRVMENTAPILNKKVSTNTLFQTKKDIDTLTPSERKAYIKTLTREFMYNAKDLLDSLKDK